jgi:ABC-type dipeptide/oligopeptide/nickel transport system permease component
MIYIIYLAIGFILGTGCVIYENRNKDFDLDDACKTLFTFILAWPILIICGVLALLFFAYIYLIIKITEAL